LTGDRTAPPALEVGRVIRPHGVRGQVVVELWSNREERMAAGSTLESGAGDLVVTRASPLPDRGRPPGSVKRRWLVTFGGVESREAAEALRGVVLSARPLDVEGELWVHQLIGTVVVDGSGVALGTVTAVEANPASDLLVLGDEKLIPMAFVTRVEATRLIVEIPPGLLEL
jgi:16S rRNA processing protein RimM